MRLALISLCLALSTAGCGLFDDDPCADGYSPTYTLSVTANPAELEIDFSRSSTVSVVALDQCSAPHPPPGRMLILSRDEGGDPTGVLGETGEPTETLFVNNGGGALTTFRCTAGGNVLLLVTLQSGERGVGQVVCIDPLQE